MPSRFLCHKALVLALITTLISAGCTRNDGAPKRNMNYSNVPDAVPKVEKISKRVNPPSYVVQGKRYYVLPTAAGYDKIGTASWYGTKFHGHLTSTGERYDMTSMSAANKELPIPCYAEVTNLKNQRKVIVKVNDRGPFVSNRIIDLSYAAAQKLGMTGTGTAKVRVRTIDPQQPYKPTVNKPKAPPVQQHKASAPAKPSKPQPKIYLEVKDIKDKDAAQALQSKLLKEVLFFSEIQSDNVNNTVTYQVKVGPFSDKETALHAQKLIQDKQLANRVHFIS
jgi:rare lipoprotein A